MIDTLKLASGHKMPMLGLGTWMLTGRQCEESVKAAIEYGYTHIDTAELYGNHREVGKAIKGHDRSKLFITSKLWRTDLTYRDALKACDRSLKELGTDYIDLYLIHWPNDKLPIKDTMRAFKYLIDEEKVRSVGLSNFDETRINDAMKFSKVPLSTNQVEFHPHLYQRKLLQYCNKRGISMTAYCPLARGEVLHDPVVRDIAEKNGKVPAQVCLRWLVQHGIVVIPKSTNPDHIKSNMDIFDWKLTDQEMTRIDGIGTYERQVNPAFKDIPLIGPIPKPIFSRIPNFVKRRYTKNGKFFSDG